MCVGFGNEGHGCGCGGSGCGDGGGGGGCYGGSNQFQHLSVVSVEVLIVVGWLHLSVFLVGLTVVLVVVAGF